MAQRRILTPEQEAEIAQSLVPVFLGQAQETLVAAADATAEAVYAIVYDYVREVAGQIEAGQDITLLPEAGPLDGAEELGVVQGGIFSKATINQIIAKAVEAVQEQAVLDGGEY